MTDLFWDEVGMGEPVLCADGWTTFYAAAYAELMPSVARGRRLLSFHYAGSGESPAGEHGIAAYARDARGVLDRAGVDRAHVVGIGGMGACTALELALQAPERVGALVLHQPWARPDTALGWQLELLHELRRVSFDAYQKAAAVLCFPPAYLEQHGDEVLATAWTPMRDVPEAHLGYIRACADFDVTSRLDEVLAPTLLVAGDATDVMTSDRLFPPFLAALPRVETHVMADTPHAFFVDDGQKAELDRVVATFLDRHPLAKGVTP